MTHQFSSVLIAFFVLVYCIKVPNTVLPTITEFVLSENVVLGPQDIENMKNRKAKIKIKTKEKSLRKKKIQ